MNGNEVIEKVAKAYQRGGVEWPPSLSGEEQDVLVQRVSGVLFDVIGRKSDSFLDTANQNLSVPRGGGVIVFTEPGQEVTASMLAAAIEFAKAVFEAYPNSEKVPKPFVCMSLSADVLVPSGSPPEAIPSPRRNKSGFGAWGC